MNAKASIIIPIYNVELYIAECAHSLFKQTYKNIEFIFVDDASPDNSVSILEDIIEEYNYRTEQITLIRKEKNEGLPQARKTGFKACSGNYIIHVDSDDWLELDMIEKMINKAVSEDLDIVWCGYFINKKYKACPKTNNKTEIFKGLLNHDFLGVVWNKLVKRDIYNNDIFFPRAMYIEDLVISIQNLFYAKNIGFINEALYNYRVNQNSITRDKNRIVMLATDGYENIDWIVKFLKDKFDGDLEFLEPYLSFAVNFTKAKIMESKETRDLKKIYELYPESFKYLFHYRKDMIFAKTVKMPIRAIMLFLATKNILFLYKLLDLLWRRK